VTGSRLIAPVRYHGPEPSDLPVEEVRFKSLTGSELVGWLAGPESASSAVVLMHGVRGNRRQMLDRGRFLVEQGYAVLLFDFQAHGESEGDAITFGYREAKDAQAAVAFLRARRPEARIAAIGSSIGGAATLLGDVPLAVDALVIESVYATLDEAVRNRLRKHLGAAGPWLAPLLTLQLGPRLGVRSGDLCPIDHAPAVTVPTLLIAGSGDRVTPAAESSRLFEALGGPKELWLVEGADHEDLCAFAPAEYRERVLGFLARTLR
jgi:fermentation-respiration switch protein FrsA (DUF1100 family)